MPQSNDQAAGQPEEPGAAASNSIGGVPYADRNTPRFDLASDLAGVSRHDLATIALRLLGIYALLETVPILARLAAWILFEGRLPARLFLYDAIILATMIVCGLVLVIYAPWLSEKILPKPVTTNPVVPNTLTLMDVQAVAFSVIGVLVIVAWAIPGFMSDGERYLFGSRVGGVEPSFDAFKPYLLRHGVELSAGLWLFYGSEGLARHWRRIRGKPSREQRDDGPL